MDTYDLVEKMTDLMGEVAKETLEDGLDALLEDKLQDVPRTDDPYLGGGCSLARHFSDAVRRVLEQESTAEVLVEAVNRDEVADALAEKVAEKLAARLFAQFKETVTPSQQTEIVASAGPLRFEQFGRPPASVKQTARKRRTPAKKARATTKKTGRR